MWKAVLFILFVSCASLWFGKAAIETQLFTPQIRDHALFFEIKPGTGIKAVLKQLEQQQLLKNSALFFWYQQIQGKQQKTIKVGEYLIDPQDTPQMILDKFYKGQIFLHKLGFREGLTYHEIAQELANSGLISEKQVIALCENREFLNKHGIAQDNCEGYLHPETYFFPRQKNPEDIVGAIIDMHFKVYKQIIAPIIKEHPVQIGDKVLSDHDIITLASIVEKETGAKEERPKIAGLFLNRLRIDMRLETDPTVIYAVFKHRGTFNGNLTKADLALDVPYNTYQRKGLPPGPICNPGLAALQAVVQPEPTNALFFVSKNNGTHEFCRDYVCHQNAVKHWQIDYFKQAGQTH